MGDREGGATGAPAEADDLGTAKTRDGYDAVAADYAAHFADELAAKPLDRALLGAFAELVRGRGPVADVGCGPGHVARYLHDRGLPVVGLDLAPAMVAAARRLYPGLPFRVGSLLALPVEDGAWGGIVAFYSLIHLPPRAVPRALAEFHRALRPGGRLLLAFHVGDETRHLDEWWGRPVDLDFHFFAPDDLARRLAEAGFAVGARLEREPHTPAEVATRRGYLLARKPGDERGAAAG
jgi:SAM-dependent methyltransferase